MGDGRAIVYCYTYYTVEVVGCRVASLRDAGFAPRVVVLGCGFSLARVWLCEDLWLIDCRVPNKCIRYSGRYY